MFGNILVPVDELLMAEYCLPQVVSIAQAHEAGDDSSTVADKEGVQ